jgi:hypothetical protein
MVINAQHQNRCTLCLVWVVHLVSHIMRLRMFQNRVARTAFGSTTEKSGKGADNRIMGKTVKLFLSITRRHTGGAGRIAALVNLNMYRKLSIKQQQTHTLGKRWGILQFVCRTAAGCMSVRIRNVLRPTDRPAISTPVLFLVGLCIAAHAEMVPTSQFATACFSGSPPHLILPSLTPSVES